VPALGLSPEQLASLPIRYLNGRDEKYDEAPANPETI
jgi:hypothetical protein